ncbi:MAG: GNAT family N-acetyltransferase [Spirochaetaceae bacterium]|nr:GNAT family N-acetyltransferase [Spirochaetaceae bacterium]
MYDDTTPPLFAFPASFPRLETCRLRLRPIALEDAERIFELYSDPRVAEYDDFEPYTDKAAALRCVEATLGAFDSGRNLRWVLAPKEDDRFIGSCGLSDFDEEARRAEIGYDLLPREWGKGFMSEAVAAVLDYGFGAMGLNRIEAFITPGNAASVRVLEKNGFSREGLVRERDYFRGRLWDGILMAILRRDRA